MNQLFDGLGQLQQQRGTPDEQTPARNRQLWKNTVRMVGAMRGLYVVRLSAPEVIRLMSDRTPDEDPLKRALNNLNDLCGSENIDMRGSAVTELVALHKKGGALHCQLFLAWKFEKIRGSWLPKLVAGATGCKFVESTHLSTTGTNLRGPGRMSVGAHFGNHYLIDCLCSIQKGAGSLLVLHALEFARRKPELRGVIAFSLARNGTARPASERLFQGLGFRGLEGGDISSQRSSKVYVEQPNGRETTIHGIWVKRGFQNLETLGQECLAICTRSGLTEQTEDRLIWRCPA